MINNKRVINLNNSIYEIQSENPEIVQVLFELGFHDIVKSGMINTVGRFMTIKKGAAMKRIDIDLIKRTLFEKGYKVEE